jgi:hypothetical protein
MNKTLGILLFGLSFAHASCVIEKFSQEILNIAQKYQPSQMNESENKVLVLVEQSFDPKPLVGKITQNNALIEKFSQVLKKKISKLCTNALSRIKGTSIKIHQLPNGYLCVLKKSGQEVMTIKILGRASREKFLVDDVQFEGVSAYQSIKSDVMTGCSNATNRAQCVEKNIETLIANYQK